MKLSVIVLFAATALVHGRPEPPVPSYSTTQQDAFAPPPTNTYEAPSDLSTTYGVLSEPSSKYGAPSNTYGTPNAISNVYGAPSLDSTSRSSFKSNFDSSLQSRVGTGISRSYVPAQTSAVFKPSSTYGVPSSTYGTVSSTYGAPGFGSYGYDKNQDDLSEPAMYQFAYNVVDNYSGNDFGHREDREGNVVWGSYEVLLPDGRKQIVEYEADPTGFRPKIRYEQSGYPESKSFSGPY